MKNEKLKYGLFDISGIHICQLRPLIVAEDVINQSLIINNDKNRIICLFDKIGKAR